MQISKENTDKRVQPKFFQLSRYYGAFVFFNMLLASNFAYANCIDESGLGPVQIRTAVNEKQVQILKKVTSKQSAKKLIPKLKECKQQKLKLNRIFNGDMEVWARTEAKGDKNKKQIFEAQFKSLNKSHVELNKQFQRIRKQVPGLNIVKFKKTVIIYDANEIKNPENLLLGHWYFLKKRFHTGKRAIESEFQFINKEFAIIDPDLVTGKKSAGAQEVVKWNVVRARETVPYMMSMGMSNEQLKDYVHYVVKLEFLDSRPGWLSRAKKGKNQYLTNSELISFLLNTKTGTILLRYDRKRAATHLSKQALYREKALPAGSHSFLKHWPDYRQTKLNKNKKDISGLCTKWKKASLKNPYCKKFIAAIDSVSVEQKKYKPTAAQKQSMQAAKKLTQVASQYLFQPIKDYSDSVPIFTRLPYGSLLQNKCQEDIDVWNAQRKNERFVNTLWSLQVTPKYHTAQSSDNKEEHIRYTKALMRWSGGSSGRHFMLHLRKDGVFGFSWSRTYKVKEKNGRAYFDAGKEKPRIYYDPANRWVYEDGKRVKLFWQNSKQPYMLGYKAEAKYEIFYGTLIQNYGLLVSVIGNIPEGIDQKSSAYSRLMQTAKTELETLKIAKSRNQCGDYKPNSAVTKTQPAKTQQAKPSGAKVTRPAATQQMKPKKVAAPTLVGCWNWANGAYIVIDANGEARNGSVSASWKTVDKKKGHYSIIWPPILDTLTLSTNGNALNGSNNFGLPISAKRAKGAGSNLSGRWLWSNGVTVDIRPDNSVSAGHLKGKVRKAGKHWIIEWPINDSISLSKDGLNLKVKNQFGSVTAKRNSTCK